MFAGKWNLGVGAEWEILAIFCQKNYHTYPNNEIYPDHHISNQRINISRQMAPWSWNGGGESSNQARIPTISWGDCCDDYDDYDYEHLVNLQKFWDLRRPPPPFGKNSQKIPYFFFDSVPKKGCHWLLGGFSFLALKLKKKIK